MSNKVDWDKIYGIQLCIMIGASIACIGTGNWLVVVLTGIMLLLWFVGVEEERTELNNKLKSKKGGVKK